MSTAVTVLPQRPASLIEKMAAQFNIDPQQFEKTIKATLMPNGGQGVTNEQIASFLVVADKYQLNPFTKEIFAFPAKSGGIQPVVSIDGWVTITNRQPDLDGIEFEDRFDANGKLVAITCRIYRKDRQRPVEVTEYLAECIRNTEPWNKWPARMLRHKALIQCARYAFGFSGIADPDEAERMADVGAIQMQPVTQPLPATLQRKSAAAVIEAQVVPDTRSDDYGFLPAFDERGPGDESENEVLQAAPVQQQARPAASGPAISEAQARRAYAIRKSQSQRSDAEVKAKLLEKIGHGDDKLMPVAHYNAYVAWLQGGAW